MRVRAGALLIGVLLLAGPASAQQYGQWSWEGALGGSYRGYRNFVDGGEVGTDDEATVDVSLGLTGFVLHPALARFSLTGTAGFVDYGRSRSFSSRRLGFGASLGVLPQGRFPLSLYAGRQAYSYSQLTVDDPLTAAGIPEDSTRYGGRLRMRSGPLAGTLLGYDWSRTSYKSSTSAPATDEIAFADWSRGGRRFRQRARIEGHRQEFGIVDYALRDLTGNFDQTGDLGAGWRWEMAVYGTRRYSDYAGASSRVDTARTGQHFIDVIGPRTTLDVGYDGGLTQSAEARFQSHTGLARLQYRPGASWVLAPYAGYGLQSAGDDRIHTPQAGVAATWTRTGSLELAVTESLGFVRLGPRAGPTDTSLALSLGVTAGHGSDRDLRKEVEASWAHNRLRRAGEPVADLPDFGASLAGPGTEDDLRGRLTLRRRIASRATVYGYGEATRRQFSAAPGGVAAPTADSLGGTLQVTSRGASLGANLGTSHVSSTPPLDFRYWAASLSLKLSRRLDLNASYRGDRRESNLAPELDTDRVEAGADFALGAFLLRGQAFQTTEHPRSGSERRNRGLILTLSRRLGGWLPIVTGVPGDGVIR